MTKLLSSVFPVIMNARHMWVLARVGRVVHPLDTISNGIHEYIIFQFPYSFFPSVDSQNVSTEVCVILYTMVYVSILLMYLIRVPDCYIPIFWRRFRSFSWLRRLLDHKTMQLTS